MQPFAFAPRLPAMKLAASLVLALVPAVAQAQTFPSSAGDLTIQTVASGLVNPWSLAFLPDGRMLVTERPGRMRIVTRDGKLSPPLGGVPQVRHDSPSVPSGEGDNRRGDL